MPKTHKIRLSELKRIIGSAVKHTLYEARKVEYDDDDPDHPGELDHNWQLENELIKALASHDEAHIKKLIDDLFDVGYTIDEIIDIDERITTWIDYLYTGS